MSKTIPSPRCAVNDRFAPLVKFLAERDTPCPTREIAEHFNWEWADAAAFLHEARRLYLIVIAPGGWLLPEKSEAAEKELDIEKAMAAVAEADKTITLQAERIAELEDPSKMREYLCSADLPEATLAELLLHGLGDGGDGRAEAVLRAAREELELISLLLGQAHDKATLPLDLLALGLDRVGARIDVAVGLYRRLAGSTL